MKGRDWYQEQLVAEQYELKRFSRGGRLIDIREKMAVVEALESVEGDRVLDIAAGTGRFSLLLADLGADVVSVDISPAMLRQARRKSHAADPEGTIAFLRGDASALPFPDDAFDAVIAMRFFHLVDDPITFLRELRRVSREVVFFDTFNALTLRSLYTWALPMGSSLASDRAVRAWLEAAELTLTSTDHDWILPYGFYRSLPVWIVRPVRAVDKRLVERWPATHAATVTFWTTRVA